MSAVIASETYQSVTKTGAKIVSSQIARKLAIENWTTLRIGVMGWISPVNDAISNGAVFFFGLNAGTTDLPGDASCSHFVGLRTTSPTGVKNATWVKSAVDSNASWAVSVSSEFSLASKLVGTTHTNLNPSTIIGGGNLIYGPCNIGTPKFKQFILAYDFTRVSGTQMNIGCWASSSSAFWTSGTYVITDSDFYNVLETNPMSSASINGTGSIFPLAAGVTHVNNAAVNESVNGTLDTIVIGWDRSAPYFVVNHLAAIRIA